LAEALAALPELPTFKGRPGWEFTDLSGVDVDAYQATTEAAPLEHPLVGTVVPADDPFVVRNDVGRDGTGTLIHVPAGERLEQQALIETVQSESGTSLHHRVLIVLEEGAEAEVWERHLSADADVDALLNTVVEIVVGPNARLRYFHTQDVSPKSLVFGVHRAVVDQHGSLEWVALGFGGRTGRVSMETQLRGPGAEARVTGAYAPAGRQHVDFDTLQEHAAPNTTSDLAFRGLLAGRSSSVWRGMIKVDPGAQQTDAFQDNRNLLLSKRAHADAIPGLEILANDVRCTHAAAVAQIDRDQLFYLMSRGLPRELATRLIIDGFLQSLVERLGEGDLHDAVSTALEARLSAILDG
jgi:Fe-S cluster assembly protein SufD